MSRSAIVPADATSVVLAGDDDDDVEDGGGRYVGRGWESKERRKLPLDESGQVVHALALVGDGACHLVGHVSIGRSRAWVRSGNANP